MVTPLHPLPTSRSPSPPRQSSLPGTLGRLGTPWQGMRTLRGWADGGGGMLPAPPGRGLSLTPAPGRCLPSLLPADSLSGLSCLPALGVSLPPSCLSLACSPWCSDHMHLLLSCLNVLQAFCSTIPNESVGFRSVDCLARRMLIGRPFRFKRLELRSPGNLKP